MASLGSCELHQSPLPAQVLSLNPSKDAGVLLASAPCHGGDPSLGTCLFPWVSLPGNVGSNSTVGFYSGLCLSFPAQWELALLEDSCFLAPMSRCVSVRCSSGPCVGELPVSQHLQSCCLPVLSKLKSKGWKILLHEGCCHTCDGRKEIQAKNPSHSCGLGYGISQCWDI